MDKNAERLSMEESLDRYNHPFGLHVCADPNDIILTGGTAGTTGHPTYPYSVTEADTDLIDNTMAFLHNDIWELGKGDRAWFIFPLGVYATTVAMLGGVRRAGILQLPIDIRLGPQFAFDLAKWTRPTFVWTGNTIMLHYIKLWEEQGIDPRDYKLKLIACSGEKGIEDPGIKGKIENALGCRMYDFWAPSQTNICASCNSDEFYGLHNFADDFDSGFEDLVNPKTKEPIEIKDGAIGEIVITAFKKKGSPYFKYATGDIAEVSVSECPGCGFKGMRGKIVGRADDMLTVKGVNVFGGALITAVRKEMGEKLTGHLFIIKESPSPKVVDLKLSVEYAPGQENNLDKLAEEIKQICKANFRCSPTVEWAKPETLPRYARKTPAMLKRY